MIDMSAIDFSALARLARHVRLDDGAAMRAALAGALARSRAHLAAFARFCGVHACDRAFADAEFVGDGFTIIGHCGCGEQVHMHQRALGGYTHTMAVVKSVQIVHEAAENHRLAQDDEGVFDVVSFLDGGTK